MNIAINAIQSNYNPQFQALTKFDHAEITKGLKVKKWVDGIIGAEAGLRDLAKDVDIAVSIAPDDKNLDKRFVKYIISEIGGKRQVSDGFCAYVWDEPNITTVGFTNIFLRHVKERVDKFKAITALKEY